MASSRVPFVLSRAGRGNYVPGVGMRRLHNDFAPFVPVFGLCAPAYITDTRSRIISTRDANVMGDEITTPTELAMQSRNSSKNLNLKVASRPVVRLSASNHLGRRRSASAIMARWRMPPASMW